MRKLITIAMPYRRLPNTDAARTRALQKAVEKAPDFLRDKDLLLKARYFLITFQKGIVQCRSEYSKTVKTGANFAQLQRKTKMYVSHFIQVLNMAIARGEMKANAREFYGLKDKKLPQLETTEQILEWGEKIIKGDKKRIESGGSMMQNPRAALVKIEYDKLLYASQENKSQMTKDKGSSDYMNSLRTQADEIILTLWNAIEEHFADLEPEKRREICSEYGISYVYRKTEKKS